MKRIAIVLAVLALSSSQASSQSSSQWSGLNTSLSANVGGAGTIGTAFTAPPGSDAALITWTTSYSAPPASVTMLLQASLDNSVWYTLDTSTNVSGELRNIITSARFFRCNISAVSGAVNKTCSFVLKRSNPAVSGVLSGTTISSSGDISAGGEFLASSGTGGAPSYSFTAEPTLGFYRHTNGGASFTGLLRLLGQTVAQDGTALLPAYSFFNEPTLGFWKNGAGVVQLQGTLNIFPAGVQAAVINAAGLSVSGVNAGLRSNATGVKVIPGPNEWITFLNNANTIGSTFKIDALPTIASGFGTSPSVTAGSTPFAGGIVIGTGGTEFSGVVNFNGTAFPSAPFCTLTARTTGAILRGTPTTTTLSINTVSSIAFTAGDVISWICVSSK